MDIKNSAIFQYFATVSANLLILGYGTACGWPSVSFATLQSPFNSPLDSGPLSTDEISWIVSLFCMGGFLGTILFGAIANLFGRKTFLLLLSIPQFISWILIIIATDVTHLYAARMLTGMAGGGAYIFVPMFVAEISEDRVRGQLGTIITVTCNLGVLIAFLLGNFVEYYEFVYYLISIPLVFVIVFMWFPESPTYLMLGKEAKKADQSLQFYRNCHRNSKADSEFFRNEVLKIDPYIHNAEEKSKPETLKISHFLTPHARKAFLISLVCLTMNECSGCYILISYTAVIFAESGSSISHEWSAIVVAFIQLAGTYVSTFLIDRAGRKPLLIVSSSGGGASLIGLGLYLYLKQLGWDMHEVAWVPVASFSCLVFIASCGTIPISYVIMTEVMPSNIRGFGTSFCLGYSWIVAFVLLKYFPIISEAVGLHICIFFFMFCSFLGTIFVIFAIPETKGKSFEEIKQLLA